MKSLNYLLCASSFVVAAAGIAQAETYRWSQWQPEAENTSVVNKWYSEEACKETDQRVCFDYFPGGVLMPAKAHLQGIGDGVVQAGNVTGGYTPSDLPLSNALSPFFFIEPDATTIGAAFADWTMHDPMGINEWQKHNVVTLGGFSTPSYPFICNTSTPITELDQLKGLKVRFPGGPNGTLLQHLGGIPVNIPAPEIYQALQTGQIDCAGILAPWLNIENSLQEVSKSVTVMNWASSFISPLQAFNKDFWQSLTDEDRAVLIRLAARGQAMMQSRYNINDQKALDMAAEHGLDIVQPGDSIKAAVQQWVDDGVGDMAGVAKSSYGVEDPDALFNSFRPYVEKWAKLVGGMKDKTDEDEMTELFYENMFKDLDPATYGMN